MFSIIQAAGWPVWFLIVASILAVTLIIERGISLQRKKVLPERLLDEVLRLHKGRAATPEMVQKLEASSPLGRVFATGLRQEQAPRELMKEAMEETGRAVAHDLEKYLNALGTLATVSPLMGLFGTVVGMIEIFGASAPSGANPQQLAHGISVALYNTALGLVVAIPALIAYRHYRARVDSYVVEMEQQGLRLVDSLKAARATTPAQALGDLPALFLALGALAVMAVDHRRRVAHRRAGAAGNTDDTDETDATDATDDLDGTGTADGVTPPASA